MTTCSVNNYIVHAYIQTQLKIATKAHPKLHEKRFTREGVVGQLTTSLSSLSVPSVDIFYLHAPDHDTPIEETLEAVQQLYTGEGVGLV